MVRHALLTRAELGSNCQSLTRVLPAAAAEVDGREMQVEIARPPQPKERKPRVRKPRTAGAAAGRAPRAEDAVDGEEEEGTVAVEGETAGEAVKPKKKVGPCCCWDDARLRTTVLTVLPPRSLRLPASERRRSPLRALTARSLPRELRVRPLPPRSRPPRRRPRRPGSTTSLASLSRSLPRLLGLLVRPRLASLRPPSSLYVVTAEVKAIARVLT